MKIYVTETVKKNADGDKLQVVKVLSSKPKKLSYIVWVNK